MTDKAREEMSALMDGEATEMELHRVLKCCEGDEELRESWRRYHFVRSVIRGEARDKGVLSSSSMDISAAVSQAILEEPSYKEEPQISKGRQWGEKLLRPFGSVAIAASVSVMVIFGWQSMGGFRVDQAAQANIAQSAVVPSSVPSLIQQAKVTQSPAALVANAKPSYLIPKIPSSNSGFILANDSAQSVLRQGGSTQEIIRLRDPGESRFNRYILSHSGNAAFNTVSGAIPYARVVTLKSTVQSQK